MDSTWKGNNGKGSPSRSPGGFKTASGKKAFKPINTNKENDNTENDKQEWILKSVRLAGC